MANAVNIILLHNHPSGDTIPSNEDIKTTQRLVDAGKLLGVEVLDHDSIRDHVLKQHPHEDNVEFVATKRGLKQYFHTRYWYKMVQKSHERGVFIDI